MAELRDIKSVQEGTLLWNPSATLIENARLTHYMRWLAAGGLRFSSYHALWQWSVDEQDAFWGSLWSYFSVIASRPFERVLGRRTMPCAEWFPGARLNFAEHVFRKDRSGVALIYASERDPPKEMSWIDLKDQVGRLAAHMRAVGVHSGDRVVGYLPNCPEAVIAMLATVSLGAIWASCGPEFGPRGVIDRFLQLDPKLAFVVDGYHYGGRAFDRRPELTTILKTLSTLEQVIYVTRWECDSRDALPARAILWDEALRNSESPQGVLQFEQVEFTHPLWILFSSGTTGLPKPIIHGHGGMILEQLKTICLQMNMRARERLFFFTTTGWMMWNFLVSALLADVVPILYDGNPTYPDANALWSLVERTRTNFFGASPSYVGLLQKAQVMPSRDFELSSLHTVMIAGSPVTADVTAWFYYNVKPDIWAYSGSGGTDLCTGIVGGVVLQPLYAGEIQARQLGVAAYAFDVHGNPLVGEVGELVITKPLPCMPVGFWGDAGAIRYRATYFDTYPGVWRHGDFFKINSRGGCFVLGRSDATLNRHGIRIGTAEIYRTLSELAEIEDALIVNLDLAGGTFFMPLFIQLKDGVPFDDALEQRIRGHLRITYSARHVPDRIYRVDAIPYTLTGKKMEIPVRRVLMRIPVDASASRATMANPAALDYFIKYATEQTDYHL